MLVHSTEETAAPFAVLQCARCFLLPWIAHALGDADATIFWRPFKHWTGRSPSEIESNA